MGARVTEHPRVFFFHYHKPASQKAKKPQWSVHFRDTCHVVDQVVFRNITLMETKSRKRQPFGILKGKVLPSKFKIQDGVAYLG